MLETKDKSVEEILVAYSGGGTGVKHNTQSDQK
jgi:hypothetical protein